MAGNDQYLAAIIHEYLQRKDKTFAKVYQHKTKAGIITKGGPKLEAVWKYFVENSNTKIPPVKAAEDSSSDCSSGSEEDIPKKSAPVTVSNGKMHAKKAASSSENSSDDSSDDEKPASKPAAKSAAKVTSAAKMAKTSSSEEDSSEDEKPKATPVSIKANSVGAKNESSSEGKAAKPAAIPAKTSKEDSSEDSSEDSVDDEKPAAKAPAVAKKAESSSSEEDSSEDEKPKVSLVATKPSGAKNKSSSEDSSSEEEEEPAVKPVVKKTFVASKKKTDSSSEDSSSDSDEDKPATKPIVAAKVAAASSKKQAQSSSISSSDEEDDTKPASVKTTPAKPAPPKKASSSSEESSDSDDEPPAKKANVAAPVAKSKAKTGSSSSENSSSDEDEKPAARKPVAAAPTQKPATKKADDSDDDSSSEEEPEKAPLPKPGQKRKHFETKEDTPNNKYNNFVKSGEVKIVALLCIFNLNVHNTTASIWNSFGSSSDSKTLSLARCNGGRGLKYLSGNALTDSPDCLGPNNAPYPSAAVARTFTNWNGSARRGRQSKLPSTLDPAITTSALLRVYNEVNNENNDNHRFSRSLKQNPQDDMCRSTPARLCKTRYNTTAPMYGVSLTSGQPVTIVQKFPDLLQQVVFEVCESSECDVVRGECTQTYVPYLFLVIPLGPVTLTGQDYVLVESGCVCKPKYSTGVTQEPNMIP